MAGKLGVRNPESGSTADCPKRPYFPTPTFQGVLRDEFEDRPDCAGLHAGGDPAPDHPPVLLRRVLRPDGRPRPGSGWKGRDP